MQQVVGHRAQVRGLYVVVGDALVNAGEVMVVASPEVLLVSLKAGWSRARKAG